MHLPWRQLNSDTKPLTIYLLYRAARDRTVKGEHTRSSNKKSGAGERTLWTPDHVLHHLGNSTFSETFWGEGGNFSRRVTDGGPVMRMVPQELFVNGSVL